MVEKRIARLFYGVVSIWSRVGLSPHPKPLSQNGGRVDTDRQRGFVALGGVGVWVEVGAGMDGRPLIPRPLLPQGEKGSATCALGRLYPVLSYRIGGHYREKIHAKL